MWKDAVLLCEVPYRHLTRGTERAVKTSKKVNSLRDNCWTRSLPQRKSSVTDPSIAASGAYRRLQLSSFLTSTFLMNLTFFTHIFTSLLSRSRERIARINCHKFVQLLELRHLNLFVRTKQFNVSVLYLCFRRRWLEHMSGYCLSSSLFLMDWFNICRLNKQAKTAIYLFYTL
jgi:hypothetical protein